MLQRLMEAKQPGYTHVTSYKIINTDVKRIAIFASGAGSNAKTIIESPLLTSPGRGGIESAYTVVLIVCNKPGAGVLAIAEEYGIPTMLLEKEQFLNGNAYVDELNNYKIDLIVLAGFLWKVPPALIAAYEQKIINIHPALLPKYGGKGMYGKFVHEAVIANRETESGITIHYVDEVYDHGAIIFQAECKVTDDDTAVTLAKKIQALEHEHYAAVIAKLPES
jgi:phosphoribosylglycinamide formyltransferase 1